MNTYPPQFPLEDIPRVLEAFYHCGLTLTKTTENESEPDLTRKFTRHLTREGIFRDGPLRLDSNIEIFRDDTDWSSPKIDGILDFRVISSIAHSEVYFAIEAKRLNVVFKGKKSSLATEYVKEGMMRFSTKKYAPCMNKHSMLGYVYDSNVQNAITAVKSAVARLQKELDMPSPNFSLSEIVKNIPIYSTEHRQGADACEIFHMFLPIPTK